MSKLSKSEYINTQRLIDLCWEKMRVRHVKSGDIKEEEGLDFRKEHMREFEQIFKEKGRFKC